MISIEDFVMILRTKIVVWIFVRNGQYLSQCRFTARDSLLHGLRAVRRGR